VPASFLESSKDSSCPPQAEALALVEPAREEPKGSGVHAYNVMLIALDVADRQSARSNVKIPSLESHCLRDPQTSPIEDGDQGTVAQASGCSGRGHAQERTGLLRSNDLRWKCVFRMGRRLSCPMTWQGDR
jgi:hypothetical protein